MGVARTGRAQYLARGKVPLEQLSGQVSWNKTSDLLTVKLKNLQLRNADLQAEAVWYLGRYWDPAAAEADKAGKIDMKIAFDYAKPESGWKYIPLSASADISKWAKSAIYGGTITGFRIEMDGRVWDMPYGSPERLPPAAAKPWVRPANSIWDSKPKT